MCNGKNIEHNVHILYLMCRILRITLSLSLTDMRLINGRFQMCVAPRLATKTRSSSNDLGLLNDRKFCRGKDIKLAPLQRQLLKTVLQFY